MVVLIRKKLHPKFKVFQTGQMGFTAPSQGMIIPSLSCTSQKLVYHPVFLPLLLTLNLIDHKFLEMTPHDYSSKFSTPALLPWFSSPYLLHEANE